MQYQKPNMFFYRVTQCAAWFLATFLFRRKILRNEIKGKKGPFVVIANHQAALDFVNLIGVTKRPMTFVISKSFFETLPIKGIMMKMGVIPKQQYQTTVSDMKRMKAVVDNGEAIAMYPAGLMCEDGLSTPIPVATYKFLKWLGVDVYVAKTTGSYFVTPKWSSKVRPGRTTLDVYRLFTKEELAAADVDTVKRKTEEAILFDAYREQEEVPVCYRGGEDIRGLEHVLYKCPNCEKEFTVTATAKDTLSCSCGYTLRSGSSGFLYNDTGFGPRMRYVSDWSRWIYHREMEALEREDSTLSAQTAFYMIDGKKCKFIQVGSGSICLSQKGFEVKGVFGGEEKLFTVPIGTFPSLPFSPGTYLELQNGKDIYRCVLEDGRLVMKFINRVKCYYAMHKGVEAKQQANIG